MTKVLISTIIFMIFTVLLVSVASAAPLLDSKEIGFNGQTRDNNYDSLVDAYFSNNNVVTTINTIDKSLLWVPWFKTSSSSQITDLQKGSNCNSGQTIDFTHNCMVTDEFSQVGILVSMGKDQTRMNQFYNTVLASKSTNGNIPGWIIYRNGNTIETCKPGINNNCDTASDATARIIIALYTASKNSYLTDSVQKNHYATLATKIANDMLTYEVDNTCRPTDFGIVCHWLSGGANAKASGITSSNFAYTGYYPDAIIAMLEAYANTHDIKYYNTAKDFTLNYLQAANFNKQTFSVPPGKSFKWTLDSNRIPRAECTNTCSPIVWDSFDAARALSMCQANYYAKQMNVQLPYLQNYCNLLTQKYMTNTNSVPLQFYPDGTAMTFQSGYFAQGIQALHFSGVNSALFKSTLDNALAHYSPQTKTFDHSSSIGVYTSSFAVRALGVGIGRDLNAFTTTSIPITSNNDNIDSLKAYCSYGTTNIPAILKSDITSGSCRTIVYSTPRGDIKIFACKKDGYIEIYRQSAPPELVYKACLANGCVVKDNGYLKFQPTSSIITPTKVTNTIKKLNVAANIKGIKTAPKSDTYDGGTCRKIIYDTSAGEIIVLGCDKENGYGELYTTLTQNVEYNICLGAGCVSTNNGFSRFDLSLPDVVPSTTALVQRTPTKPQSTLTKLSSAIDVSKLPITITPSGTLVLDIMDGLSCRKVQYNTQFGWNEAKICEKGNTYEMYLLSSPNDASICINNNCVGKSKGFISFT